MAANLASKFYQEPPWRRPTRLVPVGAVRVDPITLGPNDHHSHLRSGLFDGKQPKTDPSTVQPDS
ncbi:hypothetical protein CDL15_Pgr000848 [Punica granatum]|uniref:Uncharacterized protein n=1 Tax=Punica granatum TaxID=22663 RepID=A0A218VXW0_PUNGR|nr:hypothetical protein CDL15_Pgr000848 [Punica granatum]